MIIALLCNDEQKKELFSQHFNANELSIIEASSINELCQLKADAYFDLLFDNEPERIKGLIALAPQPVFINYPQQTMADMPLHFIRINGWYSFLKQEIIEAYTATSKTKELAESVFSLLGKKIAWEKDTPGFVAARIIAMIINEAYYTLNEKVSSKEDIDAAMKYGTNYPYGPFEWSRIIGLQNIATLLQHLSSEQKRYTPSSLLLKEAFQ